MRRNNNIYWKDYVEQLDAAGITPAQEIEDIFGEIRDRNGEFYDRYRERLRIVSERLETQETIKEGRRKRTFSEYMNEVVCMPANRMTEIERQYPVKFEPRGDGTYTAYREIPDDLREELRLLHWCFLELETVDTRLMADDSRKKKGE